MSNEYNYDAVIIGSGIGGLVCGCYLAKEGMKVLIAEKNFKVGGYCTSFVRDGIVFDACVHTIGSCREDGIVTNILRDLKIEKEIIFSRISPLRFIISEDKKLEVDANIQSTIDNLCRYFPKERKNLELFFNIVMNEEYIKLAAKLRDLTFNKFLKTYTTNRELNNLFSFLLFQSAGLPSNSISAFFGVILLREYIIDGGYYLKNGIQELPDKLRDTFIKSGGTILLNSEVEKIIIKEGESVIRIKTGEEIRAHTIISNVDVIHTLRNLLGMNETEEMLKPLLMMKQSLSCFILYLKLNKDPLFSSYVHFFSLKKDIKNHIYDRLVRNDFSNIYIDCFFSKFDNGNKAIISLIVPFNDKDFWIKNKNILTEKIVKEFMRKINLNNEDIELKQIVTPISLYNWSYSYRGANFGWAPLVSQVFPKFKLISKIPNLYFVGHWLGMGHGISTVAYLGKSVANTVLSRRK